MEIWKDIKNFEGLYQVSNLGRVKSLPRTINKRKCKEIIKTATLSNKGYYRLSLCKNGTTKYYAIHRLVAEAFVPNPNNFPIVNHKDTNRTNNNANNLEWCTYKYNSNYGNVRAKRLISKAILYLDKEKNQNIIEELENIKKKII